MTFKFQPILTIATAISLIILLGLGNWQIQRLAWKEGLITQIEARADAAPITLDELWRHHPDVKDFKRINYYAVQLEGQFNYSAEAHVFGTFEGTPGWFIFTPLKLRNFDKDQPSYIYINRGFSKEKRSGEHVTDNIIVTGLIRAYHRPGGFAKYVQAPNFPEKNEWYDRNPMDFAAHHQIDAYSFWVDGNHIYDQDGESLAEINATTDLALPNRHLEYALTWFGLAATLFIMYFVLSFKRQK